MAQERGSDLAFSIFDEIAQRACDEHGIPRFDIADDASWNLLATQYETKLAVGAIEESISDVMREWLLERAPFTFVHGTRLSAAVHAFGKAARKKLGLNLKPWDEMDLAYREDKELHIEARYASRSRVVNSQYIRLPVGDASTLLTIVLDQAGAFAIYSASPPTRNLTHWIVFAWADRSTATSGSAPLLSAEFQRADVIVLLEQWLTRRQAGLETPDLHAIVIALADLRELEKLISETVPFSWRHPELLDRLCWYWWGALYDVYDMFAHRVLMTGTAETQDRVR